jgi:hypothetical protein
MKALRAIESPLTRVKFDIIEGGGRINFCNMWNELLYQYYQYGGCRI